MQSDGDITNVIGALRDCVFEPHKEEINHKGKCAISSGRLETQDKNRCFYLYSGNVK